MKKKPQRGSFSGWKDLDEKIIFASRAGNYGAGQELLSRFFDIRYRVGKSVSPTIVKLLDSWEFNHAFFDAYMNTMSHYLPHRGATVRTYFSTVMKNALIYEASSNQIFQRANTLSLDEELSSKEGGEYCLNDIIPVERDNYNDVTYYVDYIDSLERLDDRDFSLSKKDKAVVKLRSDGLTYEEIGQALNIKPSKARKSYLKFYDTILETVKGGAVDGIKKELDRLA